MPLIIAADNLHVLNPAVAQALDTLNPLPLQDLARRCEQAGANLLDINPGFLPPRRHDRMAFMVESVQQVTNLRLILDSPDARVLARGGLDGRKVLLRRGDGIPALRRGIRRPGRRRRQHRQE